MQELGGIAFTVLANMTVLLAVWLAMGKRQIGELTPLDLAISITAGTVAGASIADSRIELGRALVALVALGAVQVTVSWLSIKYRTVFTKLNYRPTVLVENGQIIKDNLRRVRLTAETLLQLLREKEIFDITELELAILEPTGKLSVLKKAEFLPLTPRQMNIKTADNRILFPVVLEGEIQENVLLKLGFSPEEIERLREGYGDKIRDIYIAFMDKNRQMHVVREGVCEQGSFLH